MSTRTIGLILPFPAKPGSDSSRGPVTAPQTERRRKSPNGGALRGLFFAVFFEAVLGLLGWAAWMTIRALR